MPAPQLDQLPPLAFQQRTDNINHENQRESAEEPSTAQVKVLAIAFRIRIFLREQQHAEQEENQSANNGKKVHRQADIRGGKNAKFPPSEMKRYNIKNATHTKCTQ